jgi:hypothetical protein
MHLRIRVALWTYLGAVAAWLFAALFYVSADIAFEPSDAFGVTVCAALIVVAFSWYVTWSVHFAFKRVLIAIAVSGMGTIATLPSISGRSLFHVSLLFRVDGMYCGVVNRFFLLTIIAVSVVLLFFVPSRSMNQSEGSG